MGCFDSVFLRCPVCGCKIEAQSKAGHCNLGRFNVHNAPPEILLSLKDDTFICKECNSEFKLKVQVITKADLILCEDLEEGEDDEEY